MIMVKCLKMTEAVKILRENGIETNATRLGLGLQQRVFPFGVAIKNHDWIYEIYEVPLRKWIKERSSEDDT